MEKSLRELILELNELDRKIRIAQLQEAMASRTETQQARIATRERRPREEPEREPCQQADGPQSDKGRSVRKPVH